MAAGRNAGSGGLCSLTAAGAACAGAVPLLAVPGLLIETVPGVCACACACVRACVRACA